MFLAFRDAFVFGTAFGMGAATTTNTITGTDLGETHTGTDQNDLIDALGGNDTLLGGKGLDTLLGGKGKDILDGGASKDIIKGGAGNDTIKVSLGADRINGGKGMDTLDASDMKSGVTVNVTGSNQFFPAIPPGTVTLANGTVQKIIGVENFIGSKFDDKFYTAATGATAKGGKGNDRMEADGDQSLLVGGAGNDVLRLDGGFSKVLGGAGDDYISSFGPTNTVNGGIGNDTISFTFGMVSKIGATPSVIRGGAGNDTLMWLDDDTDRDLYPEALKVFGGGGADIFDFGFYNTGTIQDFKPGVDKVDLSTHLSRENTSFEELMTMVTDTPNGAKLKLNYTTIANHEFVFKGVMADDFIDGDFIF